MTEKTYSVFVEFQVDLPDHWQQNDVELLVSHYMPSETRGGTKIEYEFFKSPQSIFTISYNDSMYPEDTRYWSIGFATEALAEDFIQSEISSWQNSAGPFNHHAHRFYYTIHEIDVSAIR